MPVAATWKCLDKGRVRCSEDGTYLHLLTDLSSVPAGYCRAEGMIKNVNTIEEYRSLDKASILSRAARTVS